ncbi:fumarylacetoacetate hydrolase family protein [Oceanobacter sp. 4_MG-2023]|uniref:fumarylacetoacetate hydrolase family protein n=1 Tax=Oceanobacter sp. 4_MG-2023 TaxID=3062623 RepID=UPI0027353CA5|nr:fumarylacetoacetate hydrolase family protein [Oceanobacter sp. 4_MG-2023]MDP2547605.1 fumarylacetoacetate hydrolase family protein [Oceanobacter sp. 4_MG-2023]
MYYPFLNDAPFAFATGKAVCVGRNYAAHAAELNNPIPEQPLLFIKPADAVVAMEGDLSIPDGMGAVHHELEIALLIGETLSQASADEALAAIAGVGLALDLTLRDVQSGLKKKGHPWERAKAFDGACPVSRFIAAEQVSDWGDLELSLTRNGTLQQQGNSKAMLFPVADLLVAISQQFTLNPGDLVLTGTPAGVGPLEAGDQLTATLQDWLSVSCQVAARPSSATQGGQ